MNNSIFNFAPLFLTEWIAVPLVTMKVFFMLPANVILIGISPVIEVEVLLEYLVFLVATR